MFYEAAHAQELIWHMVRRGIATLFLPPDVKARHCRSHSGKVVLHDIPLYREFAMLGVGMTRLPTRAQSCASGSCLRLMNCPSGCWRRSILQARGLMLKVGSAIDATLISAPNPTKKAGTRDPEMSQTPKDGSRYFGMKAHIGVDVESGLEHTVKRTPANVHDVTVAHALLHGKEKVAFADAGYVAIKRRGETGALQCTSRCGQANEENWTAAGGSIGFTTKSSD
jgi:hypothetical protein